MLYYVMTFQFNTYIYEVDMANCNHEEVDIHIVIHVYDALKRGAKKVMVSTVDTDVVVISQFYNIMS